MYESLSWVMPRQEALRYMRMDVFGAGSDKSGGDDEPGEPLSSSHLELLRNICDPNSLDGQIFWVMGHLCRRLASWGHDVSGFLHGCLCHTMQDRREEKEAKSQNKRKRPTIADSAEECPMKGRMAVALAAGFAEEAIEQLQALKVPSRAQRALRTLRASSQGAEAAANLLGSYSAAVGRLTFRMKQSFGYWSQLPWSLLMCMKPFMAKFSTAEEVTVRGQGVVVVLLENPRTHTQTMIAHLHTRARAPRTHTPTPTHPHARSFDSGLRGA